MTYRKAIQNLYKSLDYIYDIAGALRDYAAQNEKEFWNDLRTDLRPCWEHMNNLDNRLSDTRATMPVFERNSAERKTGYYWIKMDSGFWYVGFWSGATQRFSLPGQKEQFTESEIKEVWTLMLQEPD